MIKAMVVDDEVLTAEHICRLLGNCHVEVSGCYSNPVEALNKVNVLKPDVLFLDIEMPEMSGLELAERVQGIGYEGEIVFITAYNQYAIDAFTVNALDYLLKPIMAQEINRAVTRVKKRRVAALDETAKKGSHKIRISLFGNVSLCVGVETKSIRWMTAKCAEVFAFMILKAGKMEVSKWRLIEAIWPDKNKEKADINLRSTISRLNKTLRENAVGISLVSTGNGYQLNSTDIELEVDAFKLEKLVLDSIGINSGNVEYYHNVILSYSDMLLEEFSGEWCNALRVNYHRYFISVAKKLVKHYEKINTEPLKILNIVELLIKYEPYDEDIREAALRLYYKLGGKPDVEKYYKEYQDFLKKELGIEPGEIIQGAYGCLIKHEFNRIFT
jgi:two-component system LytT family response regulator